MAETEAEFGCAKTLLRRGMGPAYSFSSSILIRNDFKNFKS